jgi:hypothetical protein
MFILKALTNEYANWNLFLKEKNMRIKRGRKASRKPFIEKSKYGK